MLLNEKKVRRRRRPRTVAGAFNLWLYILDEHGAPVHERDTLTWARWLETAERHLADDSIGPYRVSTIFLGIDQGLGREDGPVLWETMIFGLPEKKTYLGRRFRKDLLQTRYSSKADAFAGHARALTYAQSLPQPVNLPQVIAS